jgi:hypothetical protein
MPPAALYDSSNTIHLFAVGMDGRVYTTFAEPGLSGEACQPASFSSARPSRHSPATATGSTSSRSGWTTAFTPRSPGPGRSGLSGDPCQPAFSAVRTAPWPPVGRSLHAQILKQTCAQKATSAPTR